VWGVNYFLSIFSKNISKHLMKLCISRCSSHIIEKIIDLLDGLDKKKFISSIFNNEKFNLLLGCKYGLYILKKISSHMQQQPFEKVKNGSLFLKPSTIDFADGKGGK
jgi:hypothetical protein